MAAGTTKYLVELDYRLTGVEKALANTKGLGGAADKLARSMEWVKRAAVAVGASFVFGKVKSALIDSNRELESMQVGMSAVLSMSLDMPFKKAEPVAARLVEHYRQIAKVSPGTTKDFLEFNNAIMGAVTNAGGSLGDLKAITAGGVIGGQSFGFRADVAAKDIQQALTGNVTMQTPFIKMLLGSESDIKKFNAATGPERVKKLKEVLEGPALKEAAEKFGRSYEGQVSTLKDTAGATFRAIGQPLFRQLTSWLKQINAWADRNSAKLTSMAKEVGEALATGARWLIKGVGFMVEHKGVFLALAGGLAAGKMLGGIVGGAGGGLLSTFGKLVTEGNLAAAAIGGLAVGVALLAPKLDKVFGGKDNIRAWFQDRGMGAQVAALDAGAVVKGALDGQRAVLAQMERVRGIGAAATDNMLQKDVAPKQPGKVNVTIKRVEVVADDADRFVHGLVRGIGREISSPSQSQLLPRGAD